MKKIFFLLLPFVFIISSCEKKDDGLNHDDPVEIPDAAFLSALIEAGVDTNGDSLISSAEAEAMTSMDVSNRVMVDMEGIEAFINLDTLICAYSHMTELSLNYNVNLKYLDCQGRVGCCMGFPQGDLTHLDVSRNLLLTTLICSNNRITSLDVSNNTALKVLICNGNQLTSLDVSNCELLESLSCQFNSLSALDVSNKTHLEYLDCWGNAIENLRLPASASLTHLICFQNLLTSLDVSDNTSLKILDCMRNQITNLHLCNNRFLEFLDIGSMPTLKTVNVWESFPAGVNLDFEDSPNVEFAYCSN
ncbi:leucine-rich repeat domain-containing protein [Bacteroidota bacterium]